MAQRHQVALFVMPSGGTCHTHPKGKLLSSRSSAVPASPGITCSFVGLDLDMKLSGCPKFSVSTWG